MSTQVIGSVNELEGSVNVMRDGEARSLATGDSIMAGDVITASDSGRASIVLSNSYGEPIGNLLVAPTGSVIADTTMKNGQTGFVFEALSDDGVTIANLDPDFTDLVELQGVEQTGGEGDMFGLFGGGLLAGGSIGGTAAAVGASAAGIGLLASSGDDEGSGPTNTAGNTPVGDSDGTGGGDGGGSNDSDDMAGTTGTPVDMALDPVFNGLADTPLADASEPLADGLGMLGMLGGAESGGDSAGATGTPLDMAFDPLLGALEGSPLTSITSMANPAVITDALDGGLPA